jgi:hypothetical protein
MTVAESDIVDSAKIRTKAQSGAFILNFFGEYCCKFK